MKGVLISTRRPHTDNIKALIKTIEVRKDKPTQVQVPFPVFIYETKVRGGCGKVIGEFVCDRIGRIVSFIGAGGFSEYSYTYDVLRDSCLEGYEIDEYGLGKTLFKWHISDLKIYDKPRELGEFRTPKNPHRIGNSHSWVLDGYEKITRAPQSWCYVEAVE